MLLLVTDIDLREHGALGRVENFLARSSSGSGSGGSGEDLGLEGVVGSGQQTRDIWLAFSPLPSGPESGSLVPRTPTSAGPNAFKIVMIDHDKRTTLPHIDGERRNGEDEVAFSL
jgi:hypothetical protein